MNHSRLKLFCLSGSLFLMTMVVRAQQGNVHIDQNPKLERLLEYKKDLKNTADTFVIQVYYGSRGEAQSIKGQLGNLYPDWSSSLEFETPKYKVWLGNFRTRLEADRALLNVKKTYPDALVLKPKKR